MIFTTSWDDGPALDIRTADILEQNGCTGTFYVCPKEKPYYGGILKEEDILSLSKRHEVGAHSITHPHLSKIPDDEAKKEIQNSKKWIEHITGKSCNMFCYPYGDHTKRTIDLVKNSGFTGARTVESWKFEHKSPFSMGTSLHVYPFPFRPIMSRRLVDPISTAWKPLRSREISLLQMRGWLPMAKALFTYALENKKPWFHLWGHSWEVEKFKMWDDFEKFLAFVKKHDSIQHATNSQLL